MLNQSQEKNNYFLINEFITNIIVIFVDDFDKFFVKHEKISITIKQLKRRISREFHKYINT